MSETRPTRPAPTDPGDGDRNRVRRDVTTRICTAIGYGLPVFGAAFMLGAAALQCLSSDVQGACRWADLPVALLAGIAIAPLFLLAGLSMIWPLALAALALGPLFPRSIDAKPGTWATGAGVAAWPIACLIVQPPPRPGAFPDWWFERMSGADGLFLAGAVACVVGVFVWRSRPPRPRLPPPTGPQHAIPVDAEALHRHKSPIKTL